MKIVGSRKSLFTKTAGIGLTITLFSFILIYINNYNTNRQIAGIEQSETYSYFEYIQKTSDLLAHDMLMDAAGVLQRHLKRGQSSEEAIDVIKQEFSGKGITNSLIYFIDSNDKLISAQGNSDSILIKNYRAMIKSGFDNGHIAYNNNFYSVSGYRLTGDTAGFSKALKDILVIALPIDKLYASVDTDHRIYKQSLPLTNSISTTLPDSVAKYAVTTFDGKQVSLVGVNIKHAAVKKSIISGWEIIALGFLPFIGFILFCFLLYRYFESFANHSAILRKILKRQKHGVDIFRRDHDSLKNEMPELTEIFQLVDENQNEKAGLKRSIDLTAAALAIIQEKGYEQTSLAEILSLIVSTTGSASGVILTLDPSDNGAQAACKNNITDELLSAICQSSAGLSFIKHARNQEESLYFTGGDYPDEPWRKLFEPDQHLAVIPLTVKAQFMGLLVLISGQSNPFLMMPEQCSDIVKKLLAGLLYGLEVEKGKQARYDKTKILQETSLAISSKLDLQSVLQVVASKLTDYADATYCLILLNTDFEGIMEVASFHTRRQQGISVPDSARINIADLPRVAESMSAKRTIILGPQEYADLTSLEKRFFRTDSVKLLSILPISHSAKAIGAVILGEERSIIRAGVAPDRLSFVQAIVSQAASAIENARLYAFINNKVDQLTTLYNVSGVIHSETNINSMLEKVLIAVNDYLHYNVAGVYLVDEITHTLNPLVVNSTNMRPGTDKLASGLTNSVSEKVIESGQSVIIEDFRVETAVRPSFPKLLSELAVPVKLGNKITGIIMVGSLNKCAFGEMHENFLRALAAQIAVSMERARLFEQERERGIKLNTIFEFSKKISKSLNVQEVIKIAADSIQEAFGYQLVAVFMLDQVKRRYYLGYQASSCDKKLPADFAVAEGCGLVGAAIKSQKTVYSPDVLLEPDYVMGVDDVKSEVCIPLIAGDKILGVLDVESMEFDGFTSEDISTLDTLGDIMAVTIDNSCLFEESIQKAERLSLIDNINKAISATLDLDSFFRVVAKTITDNAGYRWTSLVVPDGDSFIFKIGYSPKSAGIISTEAMLAMLEDKLKSVMLNASPEFVSFSQLANLGVPEKLQSVVDAGIRNLALFPIGDESRAEAVMIVGTSRSDGFSTQELQLIKDLAVHLRIAWQNAQLYKELKTAYEQVQDAQDRIIQTEKLRALGEMSSGVVHDFNNILAAILGRLTNYNH